MVDYAQYPPSMPHDFELYSSNQEQHLDFHHNLPYVPASTYAMEHTFSASYDHMATLAEMQRPQDLQYHYDAIAQGVKPYQYQTPAGSPHSTSHSFHEQPPILSASSESGASVSSSAMGSPSLVPHFNDSWSTMGLGVTTGYEYPGMVATDKSYVGKSTVPLPTVSSSSSSSFIASPTSPIYKRHVFKTPTTPASATWSSKPNERRNSLLPHGFMRDMASTSSPSVISVSQSSQLSQTCRLPPNAINDGD
jgi:hypothetical protein